MQWGPTLPLCVCGLLWSSRNTQLSCLWAWLCRSLHTTSVNILAAVKDPHTRCEVSAVPHYGETRWHPLSPLPPWSSRVTQSHGPLPCHSSGGCCCGTGRMWWPARNGQEDVWGSQDTVTPPATGTPQVWCAKPLWRGRKHPRFVNAFVQKEQPQPTTEGRQTVRLNCRHTNSHQQFNLGVRHQGGLHDICCCPTSCITYGPIFQISGVAVQGMLHICLAVVGNCSSVIFGNYHIKFGSQANPRSILPGTLAVTG